MSESRGDAGVLRGFLAVSSAKMRALGVLYAAELAAGGVGNLELAASGKEMQELAAEVQYELDLAAELQAERMQLEVDLKAALQLKELLCLAPPWGKELIAASVAEKEVGVLPYLPDELAACAAGAAALSAAGCRRWGGPPLPGPGARVSCHRLRRSWRGSLGWAASVRGTIC